MNITFGYLEPVEWPDAPTRFRQEAQFRSDYDQTRTLLLSELEKLGVKSVVVRANVRRTDIRRDGWPKSDARAEFPGVLISFEVKGVPMQFFSDRYVGWKDNMRGIALSLEALRAVERYGCTRNHQQYRGYSALPPGDGAGPSAAPMMTRAQAAEFLAQHSGFQVSTILEDREARDFAHQRAVKKLHPDRGGSPDEFLKLTTAAAVLQG